jgi:SAM-dependent methyltransferase
MQPEYDNYLALIRRFCGLTPETAVLEIGTGTGWFPLLCKRDGIRCKGLEISSQLIEYARDYGRQYGLEPDIELGNIETADLGESRYDAIMANSVFEHIEHWRPSIAKVHRALKPGGMFFFTSTNKFSLISYEYKFPLYGWMPDKMRYRLRIARQGPDIMKLGIDFNQFTHPGLKSVFRELGFAKIYDRIELVDLDRFSSLKQKALRFARSFSPLKGLILTFCDATVFVCVK